MINEHEGHGGSYSLDKKTGQRILVERTVDGSQPEAPQSKPTKAKKSKEATQNDQADT